MFYFQYKNVKKQPGTPSKKTLRMLFPQNTKKSFNNFCLQMQEVVSGSEFFFKCRYLPTYIIDFIKVRFTLI